MTEIKSRAQEVLENAAYTQAYEALQAKYYKEWRDSPPGSDEREYWGQLHDLVDDLNAHFEAQMGNGVIDDFQQKRREA